ncbi:hypothetical protein [Poseidonibacter ostreae]|uniref:Lipoprotein n=1 Tax=Poseidonibacter ostreae TaxID=2654171 RepID=A0A6L4WQB9_9BACT|nr:hypothetical protein [Poseidonibacter ostreae]KAB7886738.1 hypothetical protein GBG19_11625 [Poseidonibacter ostreae]
MKKEIMKISVAIVTSSILFTGCVNNSQIKQSKTFDIIKVDNYKTNPEYYKPIVLKLPTTDFNGKVSAEYDISTYDFSQDIDWLLKLEYKEHYIENVIKTPSSYKITLSGADGFITFYYNYEINKNDNSVTLTYRDTFEFRQKGGLFAMKINKVLQEHNDASQGIFQRIDDMYFYKNDVTIEGEIISKLPPEEVKTNLETTFGDWRTSRYDGTLFKGFKSQYIKWNDKDKFVGNHFYRLKNGKIYSVLYKNVNNEKVGIPISFAVYPYRGGSKVLYGSNIKYMISTSSRETFNKKDITQLKTYIKTIVNK